MTKNIFAIAAQSTLANAVLPLLATETNIITAGRHNCDVFCDVTERIDIPDHIDTVLNFSASIGGSTDEEITTALDTNVRGILKICQAARKANVSHIINISSTFALLDNEDPQLSIYALTKRHADDLAKYYCHRNKIALTILRPSRIYGDSYAFAKGQPFLYNLIDTARRGQDITLYGSGPITRNYIHAHDLAEILKRIIELQTTGIYTCAHPSDNTYSQIAQTAQYVFESGGKILQLENAPAPPSDTSNPDMPLYDIIKYRPEIDIETGIKRIKQTFQKGGST